MTTKNRLQEKNITNANTGLFKTGIKNCAGKTNSPTQHTNTKSIISYFFITFMALSNVSPE